jgi:hypothetical protein
VNVIPADLLDPALFLEALLEQVRDLPGCLLAHPSTLPRPLSSS